ncbi:MAG: hypothetical protein HOO67_06455, partial [Candidatus Peribacteraceae bacterium]|nr:hypothetical protein [Candidatus Peribacteraceae bacterium]
MVGGGTLGDFPTVLALLAVISHRYPGSRVEDLHYSTIAHHAGVRWGSSETAYVSNEVRQDSLDQTKRWFAGGQGLRKLYAGTPNPLDAMIDSQKLRRDFSGSKWTKAMEEYEEVVAWAKEHPDDVRTGDASWNA